MQLGLSVDDMRLLTIGMIFDMMCESGNDKEKYALLATQDDFDRF